MKRKNTLIGFIVVATFIGIVARRRHNKVENTPTEEPKKKRRKEVLCLDAMRQLYGQHID